MESNPEHSQVSGTVTPMDAEAGFKEMMDKSLPGSPAYEVARELRGLGGSVIALAGDALNPPQTMRSSDSCQE